MAKNDDDSFEGVEAEKEEDIYEEETRDELEESEEITPTEEGFMEGYEEEDKAASCAACGKVIVEKENVVERKVKGQHLRFCSERCSDKYGSKK